MVTAVLITVGVALMGFGGIMLTAWIGGKSSWFGGDVLDRPGGTKIDRQFLHLYFAAAVLAPLFFGGIALVLGLRRLVGSP